MEVDVERKRTNEMKFITENMTKLMDKHEESMANLRKEITELGQMLTST